MRNYLQLMDRVLKHGDTNRRDRTGTGTISVFAPSPLQFDLSAGFPILTSKKVLFKHVVVELLWFLRGDSNIKWLHENKVHIWDEWADENGDLGPVYGCQWRNWGNTHDQLSKVIDDIRQDPYSRRLIVSSWNVSELEKMKLPPCHLLFQFYVAEGKLSMLMYQRSADLFLGLPFNIASYAILLQLVAQHCKLTPHILTVQIGDAHIYINHIDQCREQLSRRHELYNKPTLIIKNRESIFDHYVEDFVLLGYEHHGFIGAPIAV